MRLLLLFLFCYFVYRYGRYLFNQFQPVKQQAKTQPNTHRQTTQTQHQYTSTTTKKSQPEEGEYVDFEEIK